MHACLKYARLFWVMAILLMAGGQALHAYEDFSCATEHASEKQSAKGEKSDCAANHTCCHTHSHLLGSLHEAPQWHYALLSSVSFGPYSDVALEGPVHEIDYPPQLS